MTKLKYALTFLVGTALGSSAIYAILYKENIQGPTRAEVSREPEFTYIRTRSDGKDIFGYIAKNNDRHFLIEKKFNDYDIVDQYKDDIEVVESDGREIKGDIGIGDKVYIMAVKKRVAMRRTDDEPTRGKSKNLGKKDTKKKQNPGVQLE